MNKIRMIGAVSIAALSAISLASCSLKNNTNNKSDDDIEEVITNGHSVSFYLNGTVYKTVTVEDGGSLSSSKIPEVPTVEGYTVTWNLENVSLTNITSDIKIEAILVANTYTITYYLQDSSGNTSKYDSADYKYGEVVVAPSVTAEEGYAFSGWKNLPQTMTAGDLEIYGAINKINGTIDISTYQSGSNITIDTAGTYEIKGENTNVSISLTSSEASNIVLNNVTDTELATSFITSTGALNITATNDNIISDVSSNTAEGLIYSTGALSIAGTGTLKVTSSNQDGAAILTSKTDLTLTSGNIIVSSAGVGIQAKGKGANLNISGGNVKVVSADDAYKAKVSVNISGGTSNITSTASDGINAASVNVVSGNVIIISKNDGIQGDDLVNVSGGEVNITANGGISGNASLTNSSSFTFEVEDTSTYTTEDEYYGLYVYVSNKYVELDSDNYQTYKSYTTFYNKVSCKGIKSDTLVSITGGTIEINSLDDGINCDTNVEISGGNTTIKTLGDGICANTKVLVTSGIININTVGTFYSVSGGAYSKNGSTYAKSDRGSYDMYVSAKGIKSDTDIVINGGNITVDSDDDSVHSDTNVEITAGTLILDTLDDGIHADTNVTIGEKSASNSLINITINSSYEGIEGSKIYINSGTIEVHSSDDGMNAGGGSDSTDNNNDSFNPWGGRGGMGGPGGNSSQTSTSASDYELYINGGITTVYASGDGLDSNGNMYVNGGYTIVYGPTDNGNGALDYGDSNASFVYTAGTLIAIGTSGMSVVPTQGTYIHFTTNQSFSANASLSITSGSTTIWSGTAAKNGNDIVVLSDDVVSGTTYTLTYGSKTITATAK